MKALLFAYYFPPLGGMGSLRALGLARYLPAAGVDVTVVAPRSGVFPKDASLVVPESVRVVRTGTLEPGVLLKRLRGRDASEAGVAPSLEGGGVRGFVKGGIQRVIHIPDSSVGWVPSAVRAGLKAAKDAPPDLVLSSAPPLSAHLAASRAARRLGVPHVADFRDFPESQRMYSGWRAGVDARIEDSVLRRAAGLVAPYPGILTSLGTRCDAPGFVMRNGYDEADFEEPLPPKEDGAPFRLVHVGTTYAHKGSWAPLFRAAVAAARAGTDLRLRFVGGTDPDLHHQAGEAGATDLCEFAGFLPHAEAVREMRRADALLFFFRSGDHRMNRGLVLGKTFECLRAGPPVLAALDRNGDTAPLLANLGGATLVEPDDEEGLRRAILAFAAGDRPAPADPERLAPYSRESQAAALGGWLRARFA